MYDKGVINWDPVLDSFSLSSINDVQHPLGKKFRRFAESSPKHDLQALASCLSMTRKMFDQDDLRRINVPTLVAVGSADDIAGPPQELLSLIPNSQFLDICDKDHMSAVGDRQFKQGFIDFYSKIND
ncbi:hypothetical protein H0G72_03165 [Liberibacter sp. Z1]|nr:hypothetical protein [Candidatus Liberibacter sp.]